jgi:PAS domain S-box-containing protein
LITASYVVLARLGQTMAIAPGNVTPVYPPSGLALACVLKRGSRVWPGVLLGQFLGNTWAFLDTSSRLAFLTTTMVGVAMSVGAVVQALLGAYLIDRCCGTRDPFLRVRHVFLFAASVAVACLLGSTFGAASLCAGGVLPWSHYTYTWLTWYFGDAVGAILVVPAALVWHAMIPADRSRVRVAEMLLLFTVNLFLALLVFTGLSPFSTLTDPLAFISLPLLLWAAVRFEQPGTTAVVLVVSFVAICGTIAGCGPFQTGDPHKSLMLLQLFIAVSMITGLAFATSIRERKRSEEALRRAETRLKQAVTVGNIGLWDWDLKTNEVFYSDQLKNQLGVSTEEPWDHYEEWESRLHPEDREAAVQRVQNYLRGQNEEYTSSFRLRHNDGSYRWILSRGEMNRDEHGEPSRMIGVHLDVTDRKRYTEELERTNSELQQFAYVVSHDLQEPLRSIAGFGQFLQRKHDDQFDEDSRQSLAAVVNGSKRMRTLIQDLLRYTSLDTRSLPFSRIHIRSVLEDVLANLDGSVRESRASVVYNGKLPSVWGDRHQLTQLFQNLISNAIKFSRELPPEVRVAARQNHNEWLISVQDNGLGIATEYHERIFEVFKRLHDRQEHPGNGIGLAICRRVVHRHRGRIWLESEPGKGSTFFFALPVDRVESP